MMYDLLCDMMSGLAPISIHFVVLLTGKVFRYFYEKKSTIPCPLTHLLLTSYESFLGVPRNGYWMSTKFIDTILYLWDVKSLH